MPVTFAMDVHHAILSMLLAVHPSLAALGIKYRLLRAAIMCATFVTDVDHTVLSMLPAVRRRPAAVEIEGRVLRAGVM